jgi:hypothetical protein
MNLQNGLPIARTQQLFTGGDFNEIPFNTRTDIRE